MKPWEKQDNDSLALHLEFWAALEEGLTEHQKKFFDEVVWRLRLASYELKEDENG